MKGILNYEKNKIKLFVTLSFALLMAFGNVNSVSAAKSTTKSTPYGTLKGFISPYNSGSSKLCEGGTTIGQNVKSIKIKIDAKKLALVLILVLLKTNMQIVLVLEIH